MYHKLKKQGIETLVFFDNNRRVNASYAGVCIVAPFYYRDITVIICSDRHFDAIHEQLRSICFEEENILDWRLVETEYNNLDICNEVLEQEYCRLRPLEAIHDNDFEGRNGLIAIRELRALYRKNPHYEAKLPYHRIPYHTTPYCEFSYVQLPSYRDSTESPLFTIDNCDLKITDACTMRCKFCVNLLDYMPERKGLDYESVVRTLTNFIDKVDFVRRLPLMGGEPFTYPHLEKLLRYIAAHTVFSEKVGLMYLYSNATIVPEDSVMQAIKDAGVYVSVTCYPKIQSQIVEVVRKLNRFDIPYRVIVSTDNWQNMSSILDEKVPKDASYHCTATNCPAIEDGRFYKCEFLLQAQKLEAIPFDERNFLTIDTMTRESLAEYRASVPPGCDYCRGLTLDQKETERIESATQLKEPRPYKKHYE